MQEEFLHYLWKFKKFNFTRAKTANGEEVVLIDVGQHNKNAGPDFFNARLKIGEQTWAGNVEIHLKSSDFFVHRHENDSSYDSIILHVVWEHNAEVFRKDNSLVPTLELRHLVSPGILNSYEQLIAVSQNWINCEKDFPTFRDFEIEHWVERLYLERLDQKSKVILKLLKNTGNDWEAVFFMMLARSFGLNVNRDAFLSLAQSFDFKVVRKVRGNPAQMEALLFGQAGLLEKNEESSYFQELKEEYAYLKHKFQLNNKQVIPPKFFRLRPSAFPTVRLSQLAMLYHTNVNLFSEIISAKDPESLYRIFKTGTSAFWENHYTFQKEHKRKEKQLSSNFIDLLMINTVVPVKFCYLKETGQLLDTELLNFMEEIKPEKNSITTKFEKLRPNTVKSALHSQAFLQLKNEYCGKNLCLQCELGNRLLTDSV